MWPNGKKAAISVTFDDGHPSQLDFAIPDLEDNGFCGTFFLPPALYDVMARIDDWRRALLSGHETGNHTWDHPCDTLNQFDETSFANTETGKAEQWLNNNLCIDGQRTYAYTCGITALGPEPGAEGRYLDLVGKTFLAARTGGKQVMSPANVRNAPHMIGAYAATYGYDNSDLAIQYCQSAVACAGWSVLAFHIIVDNAAPQAPTETRRSVYRAVLDHLNSNQGDYWIAPFRTVYRYIARHTP